MQLLNEMTLNEYADFICEDLRYRCRRDREKYFPEDVMINLMVGQTYSNALLTIENYGKLVTVYRGIVSSNEPLIRAGTSKEDIDAIYQAITLPTEADILAALNN